jgi:DNA-binding MarR family transcriptional regulator
MNPSPEVVARFQNLATRLLRQARLNEDGSGLTSAQYSALSSLNSHPGATVTELARLEQVSHPTMSRTVGGLADKGLVERTGDPTDRRSTRLALSEAGQAAYRAFYARRLEIIAGVLGQLKPETIQDLLAAIERAVPGVEP